jgi:spore photoproduct lyase
MTLKAGRKTTVTITKLYIDQEVKDFPESVSIQSRLNLPVEVVTHFQQVFDYILSSNDPILKGKQTLYLTLNKGAFVKKCPGTRCYTCCDYKILHIGTFCHLDCTYCILQSYFHPPVLQYFVNHQNLRVELDGLFARRKITRIGTGEFTDSMIWELWTDLASLLVPIFSDQQYSALELKTKTTAIEGLRSLAHNRKTIAAWSLNTNQVIHHEEGSTASLSARLKAAAKCASWGYPLAFHFDPMIIYEECETEYRQVIQQLFAVVNPDDIVWISLGTLRFMPALKKIIQNRFPQSRIIYGEFVTGLDGKMRYFKPLRIDLYRRMVSWIREFAPDVCIYLCMEDNDVWQQSLGFIPGDHGGLPRMLDERAMRHCHLDPEGLIEK